MALSDDYEAQSWFWPRETASRERAEAFLKKQEQGRFIVRHSSVAPNLALSHRLPSGDIGHALIEKKPNGWTINSSDKCFPSVELLLRSRTLKFPRPGEEGTPGRVEPPPGGKVLIKEVDTSAPPPAAAASSPSPTPKPHFENSEALDKVLACLVNPNVKTLELFSMNLDSLPSEVRDLAQLQQLYLSNNSFVKFPPEIFSLTNLRTLWIQANQLTSLPPEIGMLVSLEKLKLSNNRIRSVGGFPPQMAQLYNLKEIWVENNTLDRWPSELLTVSSLERVWLDQNQIAEIPSQIAGLVRLERLSMNRNLLEAVPAEIGRCRQLEKLWLNDNQIVRIPAELNNCVRLQTLALATNRIADMPDLSALTNLVDLRLESNPFADMGGLSGGGTGDLSGLMGSASSLRTSAVGAASVLGGGASNASNHGTRAPPQKAKSVSGFRLFGQRHKSGETAVDLIEALHAAIRQGDVRAVKKIMKDRKKSSIDMSVLDNEGLTPLNAAVKLGFEEVVGVMTHKDAMRVDEINLKDKFGYTALHWAVCGSDDAILFRLLKFSGLDVTIANNDGNTPLHYFCEKNHSPECEKIGQALVDRGAGVNTRNQNGETPLHKAVLNKSVRLMMLRLLLKNGADVNQPNNNRETPLFYAIYMKREDLVMMLLKAGASLSVRTKDNKSPREVAQREGAERIAKVLKDAEELHAWLSGLALDSYFPAFVKEELWLDTVPDIDESLLDNLGVRTAGHRVKLLNACRELKTQRQLTTMAGKSAALELEQPPIFASTAASAEKEFLASLTESADLKDGEFIKFEDLELCRELGSGASGKVFEAIYKGKQVAVKVLKELKDGAEIEDFKKELEIMTRIRDPHMVFFYGVCLKPKMCMVMEFCGRGSLFHVLNKAGLNVGWSQALEWGAQAAGGTACLHDHGIVHRDLKSLNLLVSDSWSVKVCDFGLARFNNEGNLETLNKMRGTMAYCPPEAYFAQPFDFQSDCYSLAIILWELFNRTIKGRYEAPFAEFKNLTMDFQIIIQVAKSNLRPTIPSETPGEIRQLVEAGWTNEKSERPDAASVQTQCRSLLKLYEANKGTWDQLCQPTAQ
jgi:ankyrin repeat protein/predicted Ser/Thr protein kinase